MKQTKVLMVSMILTLLLILSSSCVLGAWNYPASGQTVPTTLQTLNVTFAQQCNVTTFKGHGLTSATDVTNTSGSQTVFTLATYDPASGDTGSNVKLTAVCRNATGHYPQNLSVTFNMWDYVAGDLDDVAIDAIGEGGVQFKTFLPLVVLIAVLGFAGKGWRKIRQKSK